MFDFKPLRRDEQRYLILALLNLVTLVLYWPVTGFDFVNFDDPEYVLGNGHVLNGLTLDGLKWAFTTGYAANWHPLTWISHMLDCQLFGVRAGLHHLTNVWFHMGNTVLVFLVLERMTGTLWRSAFVAALFGWHPLHVESVAWVSERKDVLSTCLLLLALLAYLRYVTERSLRRYLEMWTLVALSLMAKPMTVTAPFLFLLLDFWPLNRIGIISLAAENDASGKVTAEGLRSSRRKDSTIGLLLEKVPLLCLSLVSIFVTMHVQRSAMTSLSGISLGSRLGNACISYLLYLKSTLWPAGLSVLYLLPRHVDVGLVTLALVILAGITAWTVTAVRTRPYMLVGWLWYLGMLVPAIGLVQVGQQARADRYTYFPSIGLFIMAVWLIFDWVNKHGNFKRSAVTIGAAAGIAFCVATHFQLQTWRDPVALWTHTVERSPENYVARVNFASALDESGNPAAAMAQFEEAERLAPTDPIMHNRFALFLEQAGSTNEALRHLREAVRLAPGLPEPHNNLGLILVKRGQFVEGMAQYGQALQIEPDFAVAHNNLAIILAATPDARLRNGAQALAHAKTACALTGRQRPDYLDTLAIALAEQGRFTEAITTCEEAKHLAETLRSEATGKTIERHMKQFRESKTYRLSEVTR